MPRTSVARWKLAPVPHERPRRRFLRERFDHLPWRPLSGWMRRRVEVHHPSTVMHKNEEPEEDAEGGGGHHE